MESALIYLTYLAVLLLIGVICSVIANKIRITNVILLILIGVGLSKIFYKGEPIIQFSPLFLTSIAVLALVMIVFDSASRFKLKEFDSLSLMSLKLTGYFLIFNLIFLTLFTHFIFHVEYIMLSLLFAAAMTGTDPATVLTTMKNKQSRVSELLKIESLINTPLTVLLPFVFLDLMKNITSEALTTKFIEQILPFLQQIITGIGAGILVGIIIFKFMRKVYSEALSPVAMITAALLTYILAENLKGNGVLAVTTLGLFFGSITVKQKAALSDFSYFLSNSLEILVFILVGFIINIPFNVNFFLKSFLLFILYILIRFAAVSISFPHKTGEYNLKEKLFLSLNVSKGIAVAVVAFILTTYNIDGLQTILNLILVFVLYSIILSTIVIKFSKYFIKKEIEIKNA